MKQKKTKQTPEELLERLHSNALKKIVLHYMRKDEAFLSFFEMKAQHMMNSPVSKQQYKQHIRNSIKAHSDHDFIDYDSVYAASEGAVQIQEQAEECIQTAQYDTAIPMLQAILEEMYEVIGHADDSNGILGEMIDNAWTHLHTLTKEGNLSKQTQEDLFTYCLTEGKKDRYKGWEGPLPFLEVALNIVHDADTEQRLTTELRHMYQDKKSNNFHQQYNQQEALLLHIRLLQARKKEQQARMLMQEYCVLPTIRETYVQYLIQNKQYEEAKKILQEAIKQQSNTNFSSFRDQDLLLSIAELEQDTQTARLYYKQFFFDLSRNTMDYYIKLKKTYTNQQEWQQEVDEIIQTLQKKQKYERLAEIYNYEGQWDNLLEAIDAMCEHKQGYIVFEMNKKGYLSNIEQYHTTLAKHRPHQLIEQYARYLTPALDQGADRKTYSYACRILRRMNKLGGKDTVDRLIQEWREKFGRRRKLMEELDTV